MARETVAAIGVVFNAAGEVFLQQRREGQTYPGFWEFPGGKAEDGETAAAALRRELAEEAGIDGVGTPWLERRLESAGGDVLRLHFFRVYDWRGEAGGREGQRWRWQNPRAAAPGGLLPANAPAWKWLSLPPVCAVTAAEVAGVDAFLAAAEERAADLGRTLTQLRDKGLAAGERRRLAEGMRRITRERDSLLVVNDDEDLARAAGADGVHLSSRELARCEARPPFLWVGGSCHSEAELRRAAALGLDYAVLSPVAKTLTHVAAAALGWEGFGALAQGAGIPVYALGGLGEEDARTAREWGAHGIGMMRRAWRL